MGVAVAMSDSSREADIVWSRDLLAIRVKDGFCCCRACRRIFESLGDYLSHLSVDGFCRDRVDWAVRDIARIILLRRRFR